MMAQARRKLRDHPIVWVHHVLPAPLPLPDRTFDLVVLGLVAEHLTDLRGALGEVARVLAPGGRCVLSALHPERTGAGDTARFIDPETGQRRPIFTEHRAITDYLAAAASAGLDLLGERALLMTAELAARLPRARRYEGLPMAWVACWTRPGQAH